MKLPGFVSRTMSLREAAAVIFVLVALLPLLLFVSVISHSGLISKMETQFAAFMAVVIACLGFVVFRRLVDQIVRLAVCVQRPSAVGNATPGSTDAPVQVPALGHVAEVGQLTQAFHQGLDDLRASTERLEDLVFKLGTLHELVKLSARTPRVEDLLPAFLQTTMRAVHANAGAILLLDDAQSLLRIAAARGPLADLLGSAPIPFGSGVEGRVAELGDPVVVDTLEHDVRFAESGPRGSFVCLPLRAGERVVGVVDLVRMDDASAAAPPAHPFSSSDLQFLATLLVYLGYAVDNARLIEEAHQSSRQHQTVVDSLRATQAQLVRGETLAAIGKLASGMAHHLNNLFAVMLGRLETVLPTLSDADARRYLEIVQRAAQDGAEVVRRVQRFSRVQPVSRATPVDLNQLAEEVLDLTRPRWHDEAQLRQIRIDTELALGVIKPVAGELAPLREVLTNLVLNAIDAMPGGGKLTLRTWSGGQEVHCAVSDTGSGMSEEVRQRAFEPFYTTKGPKSTGLGLSVTYGIVQRHNGRIDIDTGPGRGTTVHIILPAALPATRPQPAAASAAPDTSQLRILVVDDEPEVRSTLADMLGTAGHTAFQASGGREALAWLDGGHPVDLVLTDLGMPGMTGTDLARTVRGRWPHLRLGLMTGWDQTESPVGEASGVVDFVIAKPFKLSALLSAYTARS